MLAKTCSLFKDVLLCLIYFSSFDLWILSTKNHPEFAQSNAWLITNKPLVYNILKKLTHTRTHAPPVKQRWRKPHPVSWSLWEIHDDKNKNSSSNKSSDWDSQPQAQICISSFKCIYFFCIRNIFRREQGKFITREKNDKVWMHLLSNTQMTCWTCINSYLKITLWKYYYNNPVIAIQACANFNAEQPRNVCFFLSATQTSAMLWSVSIQTSWWWAARFMLLISEPLLFMLENITSGQASCSALYKRVQ